MSEKAVIFDIDGTLSDRRHRLHYLEKKKDWKSFFDNLNFAPPIKASFDFLFDHLNQGHKVILLTGRPEEYREKTVRWLKKHRVQPEMYELFMRETKNFESDVSLKERLFRTHSSDLNVIKVYDDNPKLIELWRSLGLSVINCSVD